MEQDHTSCGFITFLIVKCTVHVTHFCNILFIFLLPLIPLANGKEVKMSPCLSSSFRDRWTFGDKSLDVG